MAMWSRKPHWRLSLWPPTRFPPPARVPAARTWRATSSVWKRWKPSATASRGVESSYAVQAGREVRILVQPDKVSDDEVILLARNVAKKIENELDYPGQIKVSVIRESRATGVRKISLPIENGSPSWAAVFVQYKGYGEEFIPSRVLCGRHKIRHPPPM